MCDNIVSDPAPWEFVSVSHEADMKVCQDGFTMYLWKTSRNRYVAIAVRGWNEIYRLLGTNDVLMIAFDSASIDTPSGKIPVFIDIPVIARHITKLNGTHVQMLFNAGFWFVKCNNECVSCESREDAWERYKEFVSGRQY